ncbi:MAG: hypothetical protein GOU98_04515 [Candidatus Altiarchaeota archaeon]|nr:hypothetical protein [Candidatus Altiarchaeota archaeon]
MAELIQIPTEEIRAEELTKTSNGELDVDTYSGDLMIEFNKILSSVSTRMDKRSENLRDLFEDGFSKTYKELGSLGYADMIKEIESQNASFPASGVLKTITQDVVESLSYQNDLTTSEKDFIGTALIGMYNEITQHAYERTEEIMNANNIPLEDELEKAKIYSDERQTTIRLLVNVNKEKARRISQRDKLLSEIESYDLDNEVMEYFMSKTPGARLQETNKLAPVVSILHFRDANDGNLSEILSDAEDLYGIAVGYFDSKDVRHTGNRLEQIQGSDMTEMIFASGVTSLTSELLKSLDEENSTSYITSFNNDNYRFVAEVNPSDTQMNNVTIARGKNAKQYMAELFGRQNEREGEERQDLMFIEETGLNAYKVEGGLDGEKFDKYCEGGNLTRVVSVIPTIDNAMAMEVSMAHPENPENGKFESIRFGNYEIRRETRNIEGNDTRGMVLSQYKLL